MEQQPSPRFAELDILRGIAVVLMLLYHVAFNLDYLYGWPMLGTLGTPGWLAARAAANIFLLLVGIGYAISHDRTVKKGGSVWMKAIKRSSVILAAALLISLSTYLAFPRLYIRFGVLHLIGTASILLPLLYGLGRGNIVLGMLIIVIGREIFGTRTEYSFLLPFGLVPRGFGTIDYFPLLPWLGVIVLGLGIGHLLYVRTTHWRERFHVPAILRHPSSFLQLLGRHAFAIYLLHQPILLPLMWYVIGPFTPTR